MRRRKPALLRGLGEIVSALSSPIAVANMHTRGDRPVTPDRSTAKSVSAVKENRVRRPWPIPPLVARMVGKSAGIGRPYALYVEAGN